MSAPAQLVEERRAAVAIGPVRVLVAELGEDPWRDPRHERGRREPDDAARFDEVGQDDPEPGLGVSVAGFRCLRELPRLLGVNEPVRVADELPECRKRLVEEAGVERSYLWKVIRRRNYKTPSLRMAESVAVALGLPPDYFPEYRERIVIDRVKRDPETRDKVFDRLAKDPKN